MVDHLRVVNELRDGHMGALGVGGPMLIARSAFLMGRLTEEAFRREVQRLDKKMDKAGERAAIAQMFSTVVRDILAAAARGELEPVATAKQLAEARAFTGDCVRDMCAWFGHQAPKSIRRAAGADPAGAVPGLADIRGALVQPTTLRERRRARTNWW
jgi:hypothetical protein